MNDVFTFYTPPDSLGGGDASCLVVRLPADLRDVPSLLRTLGRLLRFPSYYGGNLDAFWDCVRILDGVEERRIALVHAGLSLPPGPELAAYAETLADAVCFWRDAEEPRRFEVWFPESMRLMVSFY